MKSVIILSESNSWNSNHQLIGVYSTKNKALKALKKIIKLNVDELDCIEKYNQTQGRYINYEFSETFLNPIL